MDKLNISRILVGGLVAGLIINVGEMILNIVILDGQWEAAMAAIGVPMADSVGMMIWFFASGFILGIAGVSLYAAFKPTCGGGPKTAICAGLTIWFLTYFMGFAGMFFAGVFPMSLFWWSEIWGVVEITLGVLAGAAIYKDS